MLTDPDGVHETEVVLTDPEPKGEDNAIHVQCLQTMQSQNIGLKPYGDG